MSFKNFQEGSRLTVLLTGGRAPVTLDLARSFRSAGHRVLVAESVRYHLCRVSRAIERSFHVPAPNSDTESYLEALESIITAEQVDVLIPTCEEIFYISQGLDRLQRLCMVWAAPIDRLRELHDKWRFVLLANAHGLKAPASELIRTREDWLALAAEERLGESLVLKPAYSRFGSRVLFLDKANSRDERHQILLKHLPAVTPEAPWVAQRRLYGRDICTYSIAIEGELIAHAAYPCLYRYGPGATVYFMPIEHEAALEWAQRLIKATRFTGQIAFDFIEDEDGGLYALECNPRATSGIHLFAADGGLVQAFLRPAALRERRIILTPEPSRRAMLAAAMVAAGLRDIRSFRAFRAWCQAFRSARDVLFSAADLRPSAEQLLVLLEAWQISRKHGMTIAQAMTIDMEWNGDG